MEKKKTKSDVIQIPIGKYFSQIRENPWIISTVVLGLIVLLMFAFGGGKSSNVKTVSGEKATENALAFLNSNPSLQGTVGLVSVEKQGQFYAAILSYQGQQVPVYITLDGNYLLTGAPISLNEDFDFSDADNVDTNPNDFIEVGEDDDPVLGSPDAPITIIEFSDYQCPFCRKFWTETLPSIKKDYIDTGKVKFVYRDFPLDIHPMAVPAAIAAECVREQGRDSAYWKMHDKIFEEQNILDSNNKEGPVRSTVSFTEGNLKQWAKDLGYDIDSCLDSEKFKSEVEKDLAEGSNAGITGTPGFFINGIKIEGALPYSEFKQVIDAELAKVE